MTRGNIWEMTGLRSVSSGATGRPAAHTDYSNEQQTRFAVVDK